MRDYACVINIRIIIIIIIIIIMMNRRVYGLKVHALNILRALFRDSRLSEDVFVYIADAVKIAVSGYASRHWMVSTFTMGRKNTILLHFIYKSSYVIQSRFKSNHDLNLPITESRY